MKDSDPSTTKSSAVTDSGDNETNVTPVKCFTSAGIAGGMSYGVYLLFNSIVQVYSSKPITGTNALAINIASAVRTLVMGTMALATAVFGLVAVGLLLLGIQLTIQETKKAK